MRFVVRGPQLNQAHGHGSQDPLPLIIAASRGIIYDSKGIAPEAWEMKRSRYEDIFWTGKGRLDHFCSSDAILCVSKIILNIIQVHDARRAFGRVDLGCQTKVPLTRTLLCLGIRTEYP